MISEERYSLILGILKEKGNVSLQELMTRLDTSESTIRRDLQSLEDAGKLIRVHGGAVLPEGAPESEGQVSARRRENPEHKRRIGQNAAARIVKGDYVYIDAGTTTEAMLPFIEEKEAVYVTNAILHAKQLSDRGFTVYMPGGHYRSVTEAVVGEETLDFLEKYHFTKGFFGTNAINDEGLLSTPDLSEAMTKKKAMEHCAQLFVLSDSSKFHKQNPVTFGTLDHAVLITDEPLDNPDLINTSCVVV